MGKKKRSKSKKNAVADKNGGGAAAAAVATAEKPVKAPDIDWSAFKMQILNETSALEIPLKTDKKV